MLNSLNMYTYAESSYWAKISDQTLPKLLKPGVSLFIGSPFLRREKECYAEMQKKKVHNQFVELSVDSVALCHTLVYVWVTMTRH